MSVTLDRSPEAQLEEHRRPLTGYCYRMLGSAFEAEDAVQETMVRAWRSFEKFEGRSQLKSWLYRIATNVCLDMIAGREKRARPMDFDTEGTWNGPLGDVQPEATWILPMPDAKVVPTGGDPAEVAAAKETLKLAFIAALQHLPAKQRAVLILCEVLKWKATEAAELLDTSVSSINSALQRARATIEQQDLSAETTGPDGLDGDQRDFLARYVDAFEAYDMTALTELLAEDATLSMPPYALWMRGHENIVGWMTGIGNGCRGSRLIPVEANGTLAFGQYRPSGPNGEHEPWALQVLEMKDGKIVGFNAFLDTQSLFPMFGLPLSPDA